MTSKLKIVSDGTAHGTTVHDANGSPLTNVTEIEISVCVGSLVQARITFIDVELDLVAEQVVKQE